MSELDARSPSPSPSPSPGSSEVKAAVGAVVEQLKDKLGQLNQQDAVAGDACGRERRRESADVSLMAHAGPSRIFPGLPPSSTGIAALLVNARKELALWLVRSPTLAGLESLVPRVRNCVEAAALATGVDQLRADVRTNDMSPLRTLHVPHGRLRTRGNQDVPQGASGLVRCCECELCTAYNPSNVSIHAPEGSFPHNPSFQEAAGTDVAFEDALVVGKSLALIGRDVVADADVLKRAKEQWREVTEAWNEKP